MVTEPVGPSAAKLRTEASGVTTPSQIRLQFLTAGEPGSLERWMTKVRQSGSLQKPTSPTPLVGALLPTHPFLEDLQVFHQEN